MIKPIVKKKITQSQLAFLLDHYKSLHMVVRLEGHSHTKRFRVITKDPHQGKIVAVWTPHASGGAVGTPCWHHPDTKADGAGATAQAVLLYDKDHSLYIEKITGISGQVLFTAASGMKVAQF